MDIKELLALRIEKAIAHASMEFDPPFVGSIVRQRMGEKAAEAVLELIKEGKLSTAVASNNVINPTAPQ